MVLLGAFLDKINVKSEENAMKNRVKELRDAKHLTQTGLALKVGSTQQTISKIEREIGVPKLDLALIMADFFNVTLEYLFCLSDKKHKLEHQIEIDKTIEEFYDFFVDYQDLNSENKETLNLIMRRLLEVLEQTEIRRENAIYEKQISLFQEQIYVKETAMLNDKMVRDKFYHQLSFIKELVYQRELSQLNEFIDGIMQNKKIEKDGPANSGNVLLDYIVNNKCEIAVKQGIECTVKIEVPYKFPFSDGDIFIILGNALDNAIEGALKCVSRRYIHIKIIYRKENLFIKISNSFDGKVKKDRHGHLISMKSDLTRYGLGLALIEKSVNKYNGLLNFDIDEENFTLTVLLYS